MQTALGGQIHFMEILVFLTGILNVHENMKIQGGKYNVVDANCCIPNWNNQIMYRPVLTCIQSWKPQMTNRETRFAKCGKIGNNEYMTE